METKYEVTDSSDWLNTPVAPLRSVEAALRCQVCKDFYNTPMITTCSHTFCSLCIRRCLTSEGKCPTCRSGDQEIKLRRNWAVQELVDAFKEARPSIIKLGQDLQDARSNVSPDLGKRKRSDMEPDDEGRGMALRRKTRSQSRPAPEYAPKTAGQEEEGSGDVDNADDTLSACPICGAKMKMEDVFLHLDTHQEGQESKQGSKAEPSLTSKARTPSKPSPSFKPVERLPSLSYSILNENALRKKFTTLGIPNWGPKPLLIRRHTEWVNLWNANCDSSHPRSKRELLHDLDMWERTQGGSAPIAQGSSGSSNAIMAKDFDGSAWSASHDGDFQRLIAQARQKAGNSSRAREKDDRGEGDSEVPESDELAAASGDSRGADVRGGPRLVNGSISAVIDLDE